jgi:predicted CoA-binding protein
LEVEMTRQRDVDSFLDERVLALAGASRGGRKFGNSVLKDMRKKGFEIIPVHPEAEEIDGVTCVASLRDLPDEVGGLVVVVPPESALAVVREAIACGISKIWLQQGAESDEAVELCREVGVTLIHGECIFMFAEPLGFHGIHRWIWKVLGKLPTTDEVPVKQ